MKKMKTEKYKFKMRRSASKWAQLTIYWNNQFTRAARKNNNKYQSTIKVVSGSLYSPSTYYAGYIGGSNNQWPTTLSKSST